MVATFIERMRSILFFITQFHTTPAVIDYIFKTMTIKFLTRGTMEVIHIFCLHKNLEYLWRNF